jgi:cobalt-precorrin 5A hydrolase
MVIAGIGCRRGATGGDVVAAVRLASMRAGISRVDGLATSVPKARQEGPASAALQLGVPLLVVDDEALGRAADFVVTRSDRVMALTGVPSVAEAAALAAAGPGARLIQARIVLGPATCALAIGATEGSR